MKILLDTSVLVAAIVEAHPAHDAALPWLQRVKDKQDTGVVAAHSIAELYSILTTLPIHPKISPTVAQQLIRQDVLNICKIVTLSVEDYTAILAHLAERGLFGGVTYDALILYAALKADVDNVVLWDRNFYQFVSNRTELLRDFFHEPQRHKDTKNHLEKAPLCLCVVVVNNISIILSRYLNRSANERLQQGEALSILSRRRREAIARLHS